MLNHSKTPELDARLAYASKVANLAHINGGQINADPENLGAAAWTYQAALGQYIGTVQMKDGGKLQNGWRNLDGEAQLGFWGAIRILSADVANDPVFGLYGYGCDVVRSGSLTTITPKDGLSKRLNMVSQKLSVTLEQDRYSRAVVGDGNDYLELSLRNTKRLAHRTRIRIDGLTPGTYGVFVDDQAQGSFVARAGVGSTVEIQTGTAANHDVRIQNNSTSAARATASATFTARRAGDRIVFQCGSDADGQDYSLQVFDVECNLVADFRDVAMKPAIWSPRATNARGEIFVARLLSNRGTVATLNISTVR